MRVIVIGLASLGLTLTVPQAAVGQCGNPEIAGCESGYHKMVSAPWAFYQDAHVFCKRCIDGSGWGCHDECGAELSADPTLSAAYSAVLAAATRGDVRSVMRLAAQAPGYVVFEMSRSSLQILSCDRKTRIANLRVPEDLLDARDTGESVAVRIRELVRRLGGMTG